MDFTECEFVCKRIKKAGFLYTKIGDPTLTLNTFFLISPDQVRYILETVNCFEFKDNLICYQY